MKSMLRKIGRRIRVQNTAVGKVEETLKATMGKPNDWASINVSGIFSKRDVIINRWQLATKEYLFDKRLVTFFSSKEHKCPHRGVNFPQWIHCV